MEVRLGIRTQGRAAPIGAYRVALGSRSSRRLHSNRVDIKSRASAEDLESRLDWEAGEIARFVGEIFVLPHMKMRGPHVDISTTRSWNPCLAIARLQLRGCHMAIGARPSLPYRDWFRGVSPRRRGTCP